MKKSATYRDAMTSTSNVYTHGHHASVLRVHKWRTAENSAGYLLPWLERGAAMLDVGCGPGTITADLAIRLSPGRVVGIDPSASVIADAIANSGRAANLEFRVGDIYALEGSERFDIVHAHQVLQHIADPVAALRAMRGACRPGGIVAARDADYEAMTWYPADPMLDSWLDLYRAVARSNRAEPDAGRRLLAWAHEAGFTDVTASASVWCFATEADRAWWGGSWAERVTTSALAEQALGRGLATQDDLDAMGDAFRRWAAHPDAWFTVLNGEILGRA